MAKLTSDQKRQIVSKYKEGALGTVLAKQFDVCSSTIYNVLDEAGVKRRHRQHSLDEYVFDVLNEQSLYWLGFLLGDGWYKKTKNTLTGIEVQLAGKDISHICKLRAFFGSSHRIRKCLRKRRGKYHPSCVLQIPSPQLASRMSSWLGNPKGIAVKEVFTKSRHFWRGLVDADGHLAKPRRGYTRPLVNLASDRLEHLEMFLRFLKENNVLTQDFLIKPDGCIFRVDISGNSAARTLKLLYKDCSVALSRKLKDATAFFDWQGVGRGGKAEPKLKPVQENELIGLYKKGTPIKKLIDKFTVCRQTIYNILKKKGVQVDRPSAWNPKTASRNRQIVMLFSNGTSQDELAKKFNLSRITINRILRNQDDKYKSSNKARKDTKR